MDTKSKTSKYAGRVLCFFIIGAIATLIILSGSSIFFNSVKNIDPYLESTTYTASANQYFHKLYWQLKQQESGDPYLTPAHVYYPALYNDTADGSSYESEDEDGDVVIQSNNLADADEDDLLALWEEEQLYDIRATLENDSFFDNQYTQILESFDYMVYDTDSTAYLGNATNSLLPLAAADSGRNTDDIISTLKDKYQYFIAVRYGSDGKVSVPYYHGINDPTSLVRQYSLDDIYTQSVYSDISYDDLRQSLSAIGEPIRNTTFVLALPNTDAAYLPIYYQELATQTDATNEGGLAFVYALFILAALAAGFLLAFVKKFDLGSWVFAKIPFEVAIILVIFSFAAYNAFVAPSLILFFRGELYNTFFILDASRFLTGLMNIIIVGLINYCVVMCAFCSAVSLRQIITLGPKPYFESRSIFVRFFRWVPHHARRFYRWITDIDLTDKYNKKIIILLVINFAILAILCCFWFLGIIFLIIYTVILFILVNRYLKNLRRDYAILLDATQKMAEGNLDVDISENLGVFEPVKDELVKVQEGFQHAVEAETRSQNMKTELVTNVSHDLKTPLTAIITYVGLLKKDEATEEERAGYIHTLDVKSQHLKRLIEDLFEMSKASSRDITLNLAPVDLPALIRQVESEMEDEIRNSGIEFRHSLPEEAIVLQLDGSMTSRIFQNLYQNIAKYGLEGTRAYLDVRKTEEAVVVEMKNVSRDELSFNETEITERFVRGDLSRSTEGAGLGLAIAKSFVEAQGGVFAISTDGDLFKATITFPFLAAPPPELGAE